jgi:cobyrinic acid a,c-diamide synthase
VLVIDASAMARSAAALAHGFESFDPALTIAGVIFNNVGGPAHYHMLKDALETSTRAKPLGYLPRQQAIHIRERHLGLFTTAEDCISDSMLSMLAQLGESTVDLDRLIECAAPIPPGEEASHPGPISRARSSIRLGVARDLAFSFYYEDNFDALRRAGAQIVDFSPLADSCLPEPIDGLYFGGGYPELYAQGLAENLNMLRTIRQAAKAGLPIYAECGGLMYLAQELVTKDGTSFPMTAVFPLRVQMTDRLVNFGYAEVCFTSECLLGPAGTKARGHSFHCSNVIETEPIERVYRTRNAMSGSEEAEGFCLNNVLASYIHLHFLSNPGLACAFVKNVARARTRDSTAVGAYARKLIEC